MRYQAILFDKDGTLIEADGSWVPFYRSVLMRLKAIDIEVANDIMSLAGYDHATGKTTAGSLMAGGTTQQLINTWWPDISAAEKAELGRKIDRMAADEVTGTVQPIGDVPALFTALKESGYIVGIATNDSFVSAERQLQQLGVSHLIDGIVAADLVERPKPSGDMIRKFADMVGIPHNSIVMVGDNFHDIEEARQGGAGCAIAVLSGNGRHEDLHPIADVTFATIAEIPAFLEKA
jgi:phosphoglycolate phosphatase